MNTRLFTKKMYRIFMTAVWLICLMMAGCSRNDGAGGNDSAVENGGVDMKDGNDSLPTIVCTLFPQYDFARYIAGDTANVVMILSPGMEAHMYDPTPLDMKTISDSDLFVYTGDSMEGWAAQIVESLDEKTQVLDLSRFVTLREEDEDDHEHEEEAHDHHHHDHGGYDPHYWLDLSNAQKMAQAIGDALTQICPENAGDYRERTQEYVQMLDALDQEFMDVVDASPRQDVVFGGRFAYSYFLGRYNLEYATVYHSCSAESDPSVSDVIRVIDYIREHGNSCIFYEELASGTVASTIADDTHIETAVFTTGHNVTKEEFDSGVTFIDLMERNLAVLEKALEK